MNPIMTSIMLSADEEEAYFTADEDEFDDETYYTAEDLSKKEAEDILLLDEILTDLNTLFVTEPREEVTEFKEEVPEPKEDVPERKEEVSEPRDDVPDLEGSFLMKCLPLLKMTTFQQKRVPNKLPQKSSWSPVEPESHPPADVPTITRTVKIPEEPKKFRISKQYYESNLQFVRILGRGAFAEAVLLKDKHQKTFLVDKILPYSRAGDAFNEKICMETLSGSPYFLTSLGVLFSQDRRIHVFMDYFDGVPMNWLLERACLAFMDVQILLYKLGHAMRYMHSKEIIHLDIKPDNILMNDKLAIKIIDFNLSKTDGPQKEGYGGGTFPFMAPEVRAGKEKSTPYGYESDYHALGVTAFYMGVNNLRIDLQKKLLGEKAKRLLPFLTVLQLHLTPEGPNDDFHDLILGLLREDPSERLNDETFLEHPFFKKPYKPPRSLPGPNELLRVVKALKRRKEHKGPVCTEKSRQFQQFMEEEKEPVCKMTAMRLAHVAQVLEKKHLPPQKKKKQTKWDKIKSAFRSKKECQDENAHKTPAQENKDETTGKKQKKKKGIFPWVSKVFRKKEKEKEQEKSKPIGDHEDEVPVEDGKPKKKSFFKGFFKKKKDKKP